MSNDDDDFSAAGACLRVRIANDSDGVAWNEFVREAGGEHHAFLWEWRRIISDVFHHKPYYFICSREVLTEVGGNGDNALISEDIVGVVPLFYVKSALFGQALISVPYLNAGFALCKEDDAFELLCYSAESLFSRLEAKYLECRARAVYPGNAASAFHVRSHKVSMLLELANTPELVFQGFTSKLRSQIRRPQKSGLTTLVLKGSEVKGEHIDKYYQVFSRNMRDLGTPVYPKSLFLRTVQEFGERSRLFLVLQNDSTGERPVAACITIRCGDYVEIPWASSLREFNHLSPNMLLYWEAISDAVLQGARYFDFGRSTPNTGTFKFKQQWGAIPLELHWYYKTNGVRIPDVNAGNSKFSLLVSVWRRLPLVVANVLGPSITRHLP